MQSKQGTEIESGDAPPIRIFFATYMSFVAHRFVRIAGEPLSMLLGILVAASETTPSYAQTVALVAVSMLNARLSRASTGIQDTHFVDAVRSAPHPRSDADESRVITFFRSELLPTGAFVLAVVFSGAGCTIGFDLLDRYDALSDVMRTMTAIVVAINLCVFVDVMLRALLVLGPCAQWYALLVLREASSEGKCTISLSADNSAILVRRNPSVTFYFTPSPSTNANQKNARRRRRRDLLQTTVPE